MRYVRLHDGSVYATYDGDSNLTRQYQGKQSSETSNRASGKEYHPIHDVGALISYYIPSLNMEESSLVLNQSGVTFDVDNGVWFEDELTRIANNPSNKQVLFQFLLKTEDRRGYYTTVGVLDQGQGVFKYVDPNGRAVPNRMCRMIERLLPHVKIRCFASPQVEDNADSGPIAVDNLVKLSHNEKLFNPLDFMAQSERSDLKVRKRVVYDYVQGLRKSQREALARLGSGEVVRSQAQTTESFADKMTRLPSGDETGDGGDPFKESVGFSIDDL